MINLYSNTTSYDYSGFDQVLQNKVEVFEK